MELSKRVTNIKPSLTLAITAKAKRMKKAGIDIVSFGAGEPDFDTPDHIKASAIKAIHDGFTKYTPASGTPELKEAIVKKLLRDNGLTYDPTNIIVSCGAKHTLYNIFQAISDSADEVLIPSPYWLSYPEMVYLASAKPVFIKTKEEDLFKIRPVDLKKAITDRTKALILNSPSNPTGTVYDDKELQEIADIAVSKNILIVSDEIYEKLIYGGGKHTSIASIGEKIKSLTLLVNGVSKSYSMTGWRIGYMAGNAKVVSAIDNIQSHSTSNPTSISQKAALEAITGDQSSIGHMKKEFESRRDYMVERLNKIPGFCATLPQGAFYTFCNIKETGCDSIEIANKLLDEAKVALVPGKPFGSNDHVRLSFATSAAEIEKGLDRIEKWVQERR
ncbi:MAG: pyridoxal phosphate-dependent aminotransferase [Candidatus Omnitrophota bacterium]